MSSGRIFQAKQFLRGFLTYQEQNQRRTPSLKDIETHDGLQAGTCEGRLAGEYAPVRSGKFPGFCKVLLTENKPTCAIAIVNQAPPRNPS